MAGLAISAGLLERAIRLSAWLSLAAPELIPLNGTVCRPASSLMARLEMAFSVGGSFTGSTVKIKEVLALLIPSLIVTVMVALPFSLLAGVSCKLRTNPLPLKTILAVGTSTGLEELAESTRLAGALSISETVKGSESTLSSLMVWLPMAPMMGASLTAVTVSTKELLALNPSGSRTVSVTVALPDWLVAGSKRMVRLASVPIKIKLLSGNSC